ncbi:hypothetical protein MPER_11923, partial [Moniliophthora perniciosa FA553]
MYLISSKKEYRRQAMVDLPLLVFKHGTKRKCLSRPESFEEMTRVIRRKFNIDQETPITFEISDYDVCGKERVEVDESAYQTMAPYLDEVYIVTTPEGSHHFIPASKEKGKKCTTQNDSALLVTPSASGTEGFDCVDEFFDEAVIIHINEQPERPMSS